LDAKSDMMQWTLIAQLDAEAWIALVGMFGTIIILVGSLGTRFGKLEEKVKGGLTAMDDRHRKLESWVKEVAAGQSATCVVHGEKISHLEHAQLRIEGEIKVVDKRVTVLEASAASVQ
jgi:hypothetical protein